MRFAARRHALALLLIALSTGALLGIWTLCPQGYCPDPFGNKEILVVPLLGLALLPLAFALTGRIPARWQTRYQELASGGSWTSVYRVLVASLLVFLIGIVFGRLLRARWSIIDDHEIMWFLGTKARLALADIPSLLAKTEVGAFGSHTRFRPVYYFLRLVETALWGRLPMLWYSARLGLLVLSAITFWRLAAPVLGEICAALLCMYSLSFPFWVDIVGRLGPSEAYAVLGLPIYLAGVVLASRKGPGVDRAQAASGAMVLVGTLLCVGSKENLLVLTAPTIYLGIQAIRRRKWVLLSGVVVSLAFSGCVASSILLATSRSGVDYYGDPVSIGSRLHGIVDALRQDGLSSPFVILSGLTLAPAVLLLLPGVSRAKRVAILAAQSWLALLCILYLSQWLFYGADWLAREYHYLFPGLLYLPASIIVLFKLGKELLSGLGDDARMSVALRLALAPSLALAILYHGHYDPVIQVIRERVVESRGFTASLERLVALLRQDEEVPLVAEGGVDVYADYERAYSYPRFLRAYQVVNPLFLRVNGYSHESYPPGLRRDLALDLERTSAEGDSYYSPLGVLTAPQGGCYSLFLTTVSETSCSPVR
jgi:hypothetical protein